MSGTQAFGVTTGPETRSLSGAGALDMPEPDPGLRRVAEDPIFQTLVRERTRFGWTLTILMMIVFFGFIGLIAFDKDLLAVKVTATASLGLFLGVGVILFAFVLTGIYVARANTRFDRLSAELARSLG